MLLKHDPPTVGPVATARTLGVEEELHVFDLATGRLTPRAPEVLRALPSEQFARELQRSTVETNTVPTRSLEELEGQLRRLRRTVDEAAATFGLGVLSSGTAPVSHADDFQLTALGRFNRMQSEYRTLVDEQLICGLQVHVGIDDRDVAVRVAQRVAPDLPTLLAMSSSSPYLHGTDTGYASFRTMVWQRWPTTGTVGGVDTAQEYDDLVSRLIASGVISDPAMVYFDVRPSAHVPTVELRVCDACPVVEDAVLIAGLFRAMVDEAVETDQRGDPVDPRPDPVHRAAMWRAARSGLDSSLLTPSSAPEALPAAEVVQQLRHRLAPYLAANGDLDLVHGLSEGLLGRGAASRRQRARFAQWGRIEDVAHLIHADTLRDHRLAEEAVSLTTTYPSTPGDEALGLSGLPKPTYRPLFDVLDTIGHHEIVRRSTAASRRAVDEGFSFGSQGSKRAFPFDLLPRIVSEYEWSVLTEGLAQRARAIDLFLRDIYGPAEILRDGRLGPVEREQLPGWRPEAALLPQDAVRSPILGFDLVCEAGGPWRVLEDNARTPSGIGYALALRELMRSALPELTAHEAVRDPSTAMGLLGRTLRAAARTGDDEPVVALLSDGQGNAAWYEHQRIARETGILLLTPEEVGVSRGRVRAPDGQAVDVLYLRLEVELVDLVSAAGARVGMDLVAAAQTGAVTLVNAPGAGIADDKSMYCLVPELIDYYLDERPLLATVPTYRCGNRDERTIVLSRLSELVSKPVDGYGGTGVLIGPAASAAELAARRTEIEADPAAWIAQEVVDLTTLPTVGDDGLEPRHVDLRAFVCLTGSGPQDAHLADVALTRVAPQGSMVVNSSRGGGAKDTWIIVGRTKQV